MLPSLVIAATAVRPDPDRARSWVERELSRAEYQRPLGERVLSWLTDLWDRLSRAALDASPLSTGAALLLLAFLVALVLVVAVRLRREPAGRAGSSGPLVTEPDSPDGHRARAVAALDDGRYDDALVEAFRALATRALRRGLVAERPALTAHELADDLAPAFPAHAEDLARSAAVFDGVFYGHQPADGADARAVLDLDDALRAARPAARTPLGGGPLPAVPR